MRETTGFNCKWCNRPFAREFSLECDHCFELRWRIESNLEAAERIIEATKKKRREMEE